MALSIWITIGKAIICIFILLAGWILYIMQDELGYEEFSRYKKLKYRIGAICYAVIILGIIALYYINIKKL